MKKEAKAVNYPIFEGKVVHGCKVGTLLGFPTANLELVNGNLPQDGVYLVQTKIGNILYYSMMSLGNRPTFGTEAKTIEVHLLDFSGDLYQQLLTIKPLFYMRENKKFDTPDLLKQQLQQDKEFVLKYIRGANQ